MTRLNEICEFLDRAAPTQLAETWDNVGLLIGDPQAEVSRVMTCLTITPESAAEAVDENADLIVSHHPLPFQPLKKLTTETTPARLVWQLIRSGIAVYSPHTGFDSAANGINYMICERIGLHDIRPLVAAENVEANVGSGRIGELPSPIDLAALIDLLKQRFSIDQLQYVGQLDQRIAAVGSACGSGGSLLEPAIATGCDALVTGEASFHTCLEARANRIAMVLLGHFHSERFAIESLADALQQQFGQLQVWPSANESDPVSWT